MRTKVQKWGNSLALRIPKTFASEAGIKNDSPVEMSLVKGKLVVAPVTQEIFTLKKLLAKVTAKNLHSEINAGQAVGDEAW
jgi:antitoxin MazE